MKSEPDLETLRALLLTAQHASISAASRCLGVSQQAVSLRIRALERDLGEPLLIRSARGSQLTAAGELVAGWARPLLCAADTFGQAVDSLRSDTVRTLRIWASLTIAEHLLPDMIAKWQARKVGVDPGARLTAANSSSVVAAVRGGRADLGLIETPRIPAGLGTMTIAKDTLEVVVAPGHHWAHRSNLSAQELASTKLVLREPGSGTREALEDALMAAGFPRLAEPATVIPTTLGVRSAVMAGLAPGVLSSLAISQDLAQGRLARVRLSDMSVTRPLTAVWVGTQAPRPARDFLTTVIDRPHRLSAHSQGRSR